MTRRQTPDAETPSKRSPDTTTVPSEQVTAYEDLSEDGRELFRALLEEGSVERPGDRIPPRIDSAEYVRHEGTVYELSWTTVGMLAEYTLTTSVVSESDVDDAELIAYVELTDDAKDAFERAVRGEYTVRDETLPRQLRNHRYVAYRDGYYELHTVVGDIPVMKISLEPVS